VAETRALDGRGRALDNIFVERLWRSVKYEDVYLHDYTTVPEAFVGLKKYFLFYNTERQHQSLHYRTPSEAYDERPNETHSGSQPTTSPQRQRQTSLSGSPAKRISEKKL